MIKVQIIGACGFGGIGAIELLSKHPLVKIVSLIDVEHVGKKISDVYPHLSNIELIINPPENIRTDVDVTFTATPDRVGMQYAPSLIKGGSILIDYSGDFRFSSAEIYAEYAKRIGKPEEHLCPQLLAEAVYGLPELNRDKLINKPKIVGNPGCFAVSCLLGLAPSIHYNIIDTEMLICDCKTGVSGAGKKPNQIFHYPNRYEQINAYKLTMHQHVCEIEEVLSYMGRKPIKIIFTPHVVPMCRGILSTIYAKLKNNISSEEIVSLYKKFYHDSPFVKIFTEKDVIGTMEVRFTNNCYIQIAVDKRLNILKIISIIDNLLKGQAGNAVQNMNLIFGFDEITGLPIQGMFP